MMAPSVPDSDNAHVLRDLLGPVGGVMRTGESENRTMEANRELSRRLPNDKQVAVLVGDDSVRISISGQE